MLCQIGCLSPLALQCWESRLYIYIETSKEASLYFPHIEMVLLLQLEVASESDIVVSTVPSRTFYAWVLRWSYCRLAWTNLKNEQMKPQQMKQKSQLAHQSQVVKTHSSETSERLSCAVFSVRGSLPPCPRLLRTWKNCLIELTCSR